LKKENRMKIVKPLKRTSLKSMLPYGVIITGMTIELSQKADCCDGRNDPVQDLTIEITCGGRGYYPVFKTERWATDADELDKLVAFVKRLTMEPTEIV